MNPLTEEEKPVVEEKPEHQEDLKGASRRSRKDEQGRDYVCGCGKRYLSYPALYTHIKTKHDGQQPEGTQKTGIAPSTTRKAKQRIDEKILNEILNLVQLEKMSTLYLLNENAMGYVSQNERIRKEQLGKELFEAYTTLTKSQNLTFDSRTSLETALVIYLLGVGQYTSWSMYQYYCQFAKLFRACFHECAQEIYTIVFRAGDPRKNKGINIEECKLVPIICDYFLRIYIVSENGAINANEDFCLVMKSICNDFCQWLFNNKVTIVEVELKEGGVQLRKDMVEAGHKGKKDEGVEGENEDKENSEDHHSSVNESEIEKKDSEKNLMEEKIEAIQEVQPEEQEIEESPVKEPPKETPKPIYKEIIKEVIQIIPTSSPPPSPKQ